MLSTMRKLAATKVTKLLMTLLLCSFVFWGVGDIIRQSSHKDIAVFKGGEITFEAWVEQFEKFIRKFGISDFSDLPLHLRYDFAMKFTDDLLTLTLMQNEAKRLGFKISDDMVRYHLAISPEFQENNQFNKAKFLDFLRANNMSELSYVDWIKQYYGFSFVNAVFQNDAIAPSALVEEAMMAESLQRNFEVFDLKQIKIDAVDLTQEDYTNLYNANKSSFVLQDEAYDIKYFTITNDDVTVNDAITPQEIKEYYESQKEVLDSFKQKNDAINNIIKANIVAERSADAITNLYKNIQAALDKNESLERIAKNFNLKLKHASNINSSSQLFKDEDDVIYKAIAMLNVGQKSELLPFSQNKDAGKGFVVIELVNKKSKQYKDIESVKKELVQIALLSAKQAKIYEVAKSLHGKDLATARQVLQTLGIKPYAVSVIGSPTASKSVSLMAYILESEIQNAYSMLIGDARVMHNNSVILGLDSVTNVKKSISASQKNEIQQGILQQRSNERAMEFRNNLHIKYKVQINDELIKSFIGSF